MMTSADYNEIGLIKAEVKQFILKKLFLDTLEQNILDLPTKRNNIGLSRECITADFSQFCNAIAKSLTLVGRLGTFPSIPGISGISQDSSEVVRQLGRQLLHSPFLVIII